MQIEKAYLFARQISEGEPPAPTPREEAIDDLVERIKTIRSSGVQAYTDTLRFDFPIQKAVERVYESSYSARWNRGYAGATGKGYVLGSGVSALPVNTCMYLVDDYCQTSSGTTPIKRWKSYNDCLTIWGVHTSNWYNRVPTESDWNLYTLNFWYDRNDQKPQGVLAYEDYLVFDNGIYAQYIRKQTYDTNVPHFMNISDASAWATIMNNYSQGSATIETVKSFLDEKFYYMSAE